MHITGKFHNAQLSLNGELLVTFNVKETSKAIEEIEEIKSADRLVIDATIWRDKKSLRANNYFWHLIGEMSRVLAVDKWELYKYELNRWGVFVDLQVKKCAVETLRSHFRDFEILDEYFIGFEEYADARGFYGISEYNTKEMSDLINGVTKDARELGVDTATPDEIAEILQAYEIEFKRITKRRNGDESK